jgi:hypothetical protein
MDFEMKFGCEGEEHALTVSAGGEEGLAFEDSQSGRGAISIDTSLGVDVDIDDGVSVECSPLAAGKFDFGEFGHVRSESIF